MESKSEQELKEITNHIYVMIYNDQSITIGDKNKIKNSNIVSNGSFDIDTMEESETFEI